LANGIEAMAIKNERLNREIIIGFPFFKNNYN
ncbi:MAG: hypothetical protein K0R94_1501, partial [Burkholderiales bacterium]|nr:hypothetical protein [Burkholderiales bacterium]